MKNRIETKVDKLVDYIYTCGEVPSTTASDVLGISLDQVEEWAKPLEENELIRVKYSLLQGMILVSKPLSEKELRLRLNEFKAKRDELKKEEQRLESAFLKYEDILPELNYNLKELEKKYTIKTKEARSEKTKKEIAELLKNLKELHSKLEAHEKEMSEIQKEKKDLSKMIDGFKRDLINIDKRAKMVAKSKALGTFYNFLSKAEKDATETKRAEGKFVSEIEALRKKVDRLMPQFELSYQKFHKKTLFDVLKFFRFRRKE